MDDESLVESSDEMEVSSENSDQDKSEEDSTTLGNPVLASMEQDGSEINSSPKALNVDQHDATPSNAGSQQNLQTEENEACTDLRITSKASLAMTQKESSRDLDSSSVLPDALAAVPESSNITGIPALGLNINPISNPQHYSIEDYEPDSRMETEQADKSQDTHASSNMVHPGTEIQTQGSSQFGSIVEYPDVPFQSGSAAINAPPKKFESDTQSKKEGTGLKALDSSTLTIEPNANPKPESKTSPRNKSQEKLFRSLLDETERFRNLLEIKNLEVPTQYNREVELGSREAKLLKSMNMPEVPLQENRSNPLPEKPYTESISTSRQRREVGMDMNPSELDVLESGGPSSGQASIPRNQPERSSELNPSRKEQPPTSGNQPISAEDISGDFPFNSSGVTRSGEIRARAIEWNASESNLTKYLLNVRILLLEVLKDIMALNGEEDRYREFEDLCYLAPEFPVPDHEKDLLLAICMYLSQRKTHCMINKLISCEDSVVHQIEEEYEALSSTIGISLVNVSLLTEFNFEAVMGLYRTFNKTYEACSYFFKIYKEDIQDEDSKERMDILTEKMESFLLETRTAFQLLLINIGEYSNQGFVDENIQHAFEGDGIYLRRRIE